MKQCVKCNKEFKTKQDLDRHLNRKIKCDNVIECNNCKKEFKTKQLLKQHNNNKKSCKNISLESKIEVLELKNEVLELKLEIANLKNTTNNTFNNTTNINSNNTVNNTINIFGNEDLKHITKQILKEEILKIAEAEYDQYKGQLFEIKGQRYNVNYIKDMELHLLLNKLIYFTKKNNTTMKKENDKFYINKEEGWEDIELEDLHINTLSKHQEVLAQYKELILENKIYKRMIDKYFTDDNSDVLIEKTGIKDKLINKKPRKQILSKLLEFELENIKKNLKLKHDLNKV